MKKLMTILLILVIISCQRGSISDTSIFPSNTSKEKYFNVSNKVNRVRVLVKGRVDEGRLEVILVNSKNQILIREDITENFNFSRVFNSPATGEWYVRAKFIGGTGRYKIKIYLD